MRSACVCLLLLAVACSGEQQPTGNILVVAQSAATAQITRVTVTFTPAGANPRDLTVDPQDPNKFTATIEVPVGTYTVKADAFAGTTPVGTGSATVPVVKGTHVQALITILDGTGPSAGPDHSPVVTSLVTPASPQVDDQATVMGTAMDGDQDPMTFSWTASPAGCGTFASSTAATTIFTAKVAGTCTVTFTVTANGKSDFKSALVQIVPATGFVDVVVRYVPQPVIASISFFTGSTQVATVLRTSTDGTIRAQFHKGTPYSVVIAFDAPWPTGTVALSDSCGGTIVQPNFVSGVSGASATWTPTVQNVACILTATLTRETLSDSLFVVVLPVP